MKKLIYLFLALFAITSYGQADFPEGVQISGGQPTVTTVNYLTTTDLSGLQGKVTPNNVPITYTPINYAPSSTSIADQLAGIDTRLGQIGNVTAGVTTRVHLTGDNITVTAGTFFASNTTGKGATAAGTPQQTLSNNDDQKKYFTKDVMSVAVASLTTAPPGVYSGQLTVTSDPTPGTSKQRFTIEIYKTNNGGAPIASGITGAPVGDLGVTVVAILDSGLINVVAGSLTNIGLQGNLSSTLTLNTGERLRYHVSAEKVGTDGGAVTMNVYYGSNYNSYYDIPVTFNTDGVLNKSDVIGNTTTEALNSLSNASKISKGLISGDSTIASYLGQSAVASYLVLPADLSLGNSITDISVPGHTIAQQKSAWLALSDKNTYDYVIVQIGLNDVGFTESNATVIARLQDYINSINSNKKASCKVIIGTMTPAKQRWIDLYGETNGATAQSQWIAINEAIKGNGSNPITGAASRVYEHTEAISDMYKNLAAPYDMGDHIHESNLARIVIANAHRKALNELFFLKSIIASSIIPYSDFGKEVNGTVVIQSNADNPFNMRLKNRNNTQEYGMSVDVETVDDKGFAIFDNTSSGAQRFIIKKTGQLKIPYYSGTGTRQVVADASGNLSAEDQTVSGVKRYVALISQTGTSAPVLNIIENSIGSIVWTRSATGQFLGTLSGAFTSGKTVVFISNSTTDTIIYTGSSVNTCNISTYQATTNAAKDGSMTNVSLEIRVHP